MEAYTNPCVDQLIDKSFLLGNPEPGRTKCPSCSPEVKRRANLFCYWLLPWLSQARCMWEHLQVAGDFSSFISG